MISNITNHGNEEAGLLLKAAIVDLTMLLTLGLVACGGKRASTATPGSTPSSVQEFKQAADELFDLSQAVEVQDATACNWPSSFIRQRDMHGGAVTGLAGVWGDTLPQSKCEVGFP